MAARSDTATAAPKQATPSDALEDTAADSSHGLRASQPLMQLGRYRLDRKLGEGGMGVVHAAFDTDLERRVAIKLLHADPSTSSRARLLREGRAMARLDHPNVVRVYQVDSIEGRDVVVMALVEGSSLAEWLRTAPRPHPEILAAFVAAGRGLAAAHAIGMVHRDFKPHNVLRNTRGDIFVTDFGLARDAEATEEHVTGAVTGSTALGKMTQTGMFVGTPAYMAPEQWVGGRVTAAADQFAFCVALWEALAGTRPFTGEALDDLRAQIAAGPAALDASGVPRRLRPILVRGLATDPAARWPSMDALLAAISPPRRAPRLVLFGGALIAIGIAVVALSRREPPAPLAPPLPTLPELPAGLFVPKGHDELIATITRIDDVHFSVPRASVEQVLRDRSELTNNSRLVPLTVDEHLVGYKLYAVRPRSLFTAFGLRSGDLLQTVDKIALSSEENIVAIYRRLRTATRMVVGYDRDGTPRTLTITITP